MVIVEKAQPKENNRKDRKVRRAVLNLIAVTERTEHGYADVPPGSINDEIESELAAYGYRSRRSDESLREKLVRLAREKPRGYKCW